MMWLGKRGLVAKIKNDSCIVITEKGTYERVSLPAEGAQVGTEIEYRNPIIYKAVKYSLLVASLLILSLGYALFHQAILPEAAAYVSLDINPSLEVAVGKDQSVMEVKYFNDDAANLLKQENLKGKKLYDALTMVIDKAIKQNYIKANQQNQIITTVTLTKKDPTLIDQHAIQQFLEKSISKRGFSGEVKTYLVTDEFRTMAEKKGLSPGKFLVYQQLIKMGNKVSIDEIKKTKISKQVEVYKIELPPNFNKISIKKQENQGNKEEPEIVIEDNEQTVPLTVLNKSNEEDGNGYKGKSTQPVKNQKPPTITTQRSNNENDIKRNDGQSKEN